MNKKIFLFFVTCFFSITSLAASRLSVWITEKNNERNFNLTRMLSHRKDSLDVHNFSPGPVQLRFHRSDKPEQNIPAEEWVDISTIESFQKMKIIFGDGTVDSVNYPECAVTPEVCVWIQAKVGDFFELQDSSWTKPQPIPFSLSIYIFADGGGDAPTQ